MTSPLGDLGPATGVLAFVGGDPWRASPAGEVLDGTGTVLAELIDRAGGELLLLPTAAAYERPERVVGAAARFVADRRGRLAVCAILRRDDAEDVELADRIRRASLVVLASGSPLHLRSVLKDSPALAALVASWHGGAAVVGVETAASVLCDPMVDPRGGAFTVGLGLVRGMAVVPGYDGSRGEQLERTLTLAPAGCAVLGVCPGDAVVREPDGTWRTTSAPPGVAVFVDGEEAGLGALSGKPTA